MAVVVKLRGPSRLGATFIRSMMMLGKSIKSALIVLVCCIPAFGQTREIRPEKRPKDFLTPSLTAPYMQKRAYRKSHEGLERDFWRILEPSEKDQVLSQNKEAVLHTVTAEKDFWKIALARYWCAKNAADIIPDLIKLIKDSKIAGLEDYADLIIWDRITSGDLKFYGHGWVVPDDLFAVAGRASWILREITGQDFGQVSMKSTPAQLDQLSETWAKWLATNPFTQPANNKRTRR